MEYSADDIAAAKSLQLLAYLYMVLATLLTYDYACSLQEESTFLLWSRRTKVKAFYIVIRFSSFGLITMNLLRSFTPNEKADKCRMLIDISSCFAVISLTGSECFFVLRTYVLWNCNRIVLVAVLSTLVAIIVSFIALWFTATSTSHFTTSAIPSITGCYRTSDSVHMTIAFILLLILQLGLSSLTLMRAIQSWRSTNSPLHVVLVKHNIFYYACNLLLSAGNVLMPILFSNPAFYSFLDGLQVCILAILATRMHLHLWHMEQHVHDTDTLMWISLENRLPTDCTV
ncbi:hypothetical protein DEU56DRAFT_354245 [Suillus clintonianus]|uniref:uncharacterized protein n=1 Tax=Suillus clintonianus TaxID=1904413 RepID=UPI001B85EDF6|nr:uncharacterized protein DEU56DRAFT_354245 [Suillus clintonianus]KAG2137045.1 hypothetical protein DEU56DRAFT_354245 [Suillus clintonianus]